MIEGDSIIKEAKALAWPNENDYTYGNCVNNDTNADSDAFPGTAVSVKHNGIALYVG